MNVTYATNKKTEREVLEDLLYAIIETVPKSKELTPAPGRQAGFVRVWDLGDLAVIQWSDGFNRNTEVVYDGDVDWHDDDELRKTYLLPEVYDAVDLCNAMSNDPEEVGAHYDGPVKIIVRYDFFGSTHEYRWLMDEFCREPVVFKNKTDAERWIAKRESEPYVLSYNECNPPQYFIVRH